MNGSRVNPHARPDPFQDFDIVYSVTDPEPFRIRRSLHAGVASLF